MQDPDVYLSCTGNQGGRAFCCTPRFLTESENSQDDAVAFAQALVDVAANGCGYEIPDDLLDGSGLTRRSLSTGPFSLEKRDDSYSCKLAFANTFTMLSTAFVAQKLLFEGAWNLAMDQVHFDNVPASRVESFPTGVVFNDMAPPTQTAFVHTVLEVLSKLNGNINAGTSALTCPWWWKADLSFDEDEDDGGVDEEEPYQRRWSEVFSEDREDPRPGSGSTARSRDTGAGSSTQPPLMNQTKVLEQYELERQRLAEFTQRSETELRELYRIYGNSTDLDFDLPPFEAFFNGSTHPFLEKPSFAADAADHHRRNHEDSDLSGHLARDLEERASTGKSRALKIKSAVRSPADWQETVIRSSAYPNGAGGDNLNAATGDKTRFKSYSVGCGPSDYTLLTFAAKPAAKLWVSEHILELQVIQRFITAILDGQAPPVPSMDMPAVAAFQFSSEVLRNFTQVWPAWRTVSGENISPAEVALRHCGSVTRPDGMVVAEAGLNAIKGKLIGLTKPKADDKWEDCCLQPTRDSAQEAFSYIQTVMAVFDYLDNDNVRDRHQGSFEAVRQTIEDFGIAYKLAYNTDITTEMQEAWSDFMKKHMERVTYFASEWSLDRLTDLRSVWWRQLGASIRSLDLSGIADAVLMIFFTGKHISIMQAGLKFNDTIYDLP